MDTQTSSVKINWSQPELMPAPRKNNPNRKETRYAVTCSCGLVRWLRKGDALKATQCKKCQTAAAGKKGYAAAVAAHGEQFVMPHLQAYRLANPSNLETAMAEALESIGLEFQREVLINAGGRLRLVDFIVTVGGQQVVVEVNGEYAHRMRGDSDIQKIEALTSEGLKVVTVMEAIITSKMTVEFLVSELGVK